jgi:hypothetical protein
MRKPFRTGLRARIKFYSYNRLASVRVACSVFFQNADTLRREDDPRHAVYHNSALQDMPLALKIHARRWIRIHLDLR